MISRRRMLSALVAIPFLPRFLSAVEEAPKPWTDAVWTTKDGRVIPITQLQDDHLRNILRMLERKHEHWNRVAKDEYKAVVARRESGRSVFGDYRDHTYEQDRLGLWQDGARVGPAFTFPDYTLLYAEAVRRGLSWQTNG